MYILNICEITLTDTCTTSIANEVCIIRTILSNLNIPLLSFVPVSLLTVMPRIPFIRKLFFVLRNDFVSTFKANFKDWNLTDF